MVEPPPHLVDLTRHLRAAARRGASPEQVNELLGQAVETLGRLVPFDLATVMELRGDELQVRVARGALASPAVGRHRLRLEEFPTIRALLERDEARAFTAVDHRDGDGDPFDGVLDLPHGHSCMVVPLRSRSETLGIMTFDRRICDVYPDSVVQLADVFGKLLAMAMSYGEQSAALERMAEQLQEQNRLLEESVTGHGPATEMMELSRSPAMRTVVELARRVAVADTPVLLTGETGTGKEVLANAIHGWSRRAAEPFVGINCAALPRELIESELFGHVKGAFSGATARRMGRFQAANGGTLFLDEVGDLPIDLQAKLLRALQEGCFEPVGSDATIRVDVRVLAASNLDLVAATAKGRFRQDLYYRLAVFPIHVPPLRDRREDVPVIARYFLDTLAKRTRRGPWHLTEASLAWLAERPWDGNVRELVNTLERATILSPSARLDLDAATALQEPGALAPPVATGDSTPPAPLREMERRHIERALRHTRGKLYGPGGAAHVLGLHPSTLRSRMRKLGLGGAREFQSR
ncbi:MAG: sigma 54-interacting transcriptional regulator [Planctomycetota bacterium]